MIAGMFAILGMAIVASKLLEQSGKQRRTIRASMYIIGNRSVFRRQGQNPKEDLFTDIRSDQSILQRSEETAISPPTFPLDA